MIYVVQDLEANIPIYKIGYTNDVDRRFKELQSGNSSQLKLIISFPGSQKLEKSIHSKFLNKKKIMKGSKEWFYLEDEDILFLKRYMHVCHIAYQESQEKNSKAKEYPSPSSSEDLPKAPSKGFLVLILWVLRFVFK
jgi:hypothetical protein